jgi:hypothetical protein
MAAAEVEGSEVCWSLQVVLMRPRPAWGSALGLGSEMASAQELAWA